MAKNNSEYVEKKSTFLIVEFAFQITAATVEKLPKMEISDLSILMKAALTNHFFKKDSR